MLTRKPQITMESQAVNTSDGNSDNSVEISPSITIEEIDRHSDDRTCDGTSADFPYVDDSDFAASPRPITEIPTQVAQIVERVKQHLEDVKDEEDADETTIELMRSRPLEARSLQNNKQSAENPVSGTTALNQSERTQATNSLPPRMTNGTSSLKKKEKQTFPPPASMTRRRHSAMVGQAAEQNGGSSRFRSLSPMPFGGAARIRHSMCEATFTGDLQFLSLLTSSSLSI
ncbi:hypothetical protein Y032_0012g1750 [Ancylostoma ceylanicum]|uniref:Uncharacterized protein n=2 Tax=Ancylostoma ceylanicum TaxID=53326 RepID=A0A016VEL7_9BILA|nr:hypothetical protein Y032_0012g1750 [Ancylostoma ceylanicum]